MKRFILAVLIWLAGACCASEYKLSFGPIKLSMTIDDAPVIEAAPTREVFTMPAPAEVVEIPEAVKAPVLDIESTPVTTETKSCELLCCVTSWCGACKGQKQIFANHPDPIPGYDHVSIIDIEAQPTIRQAIETATNYHIHAIPTSFVKCGNFINATPHIGVFSTDEIASWVGQRDTKASPAKVQVKTPLNISSKKHRHWEEDAYGQGHYVYD